MRVSFRALAACAFMALASTAAPLAAQVAAQGFVVKRQLTIRGTPAQVYAALIQPARWWNPAHTYSRDAGNLSLEARPGGCFCERLKEGGGVEHMRVVYVAPGQALRMTGGMGPLQASGVAGAMTWSLTAAGDSTRLDLNYSVGGFLEGGFEKMAPLVEQVLGEQADRLKRYLETGRPEAPKP